MLLKYSNPTQNPNPHKELIYNILPNTCVHNLNFNQHYPKKITIQYQHKIKHIHKHTQLYKCLQIHL